jgi:hypothetical protein
MQFDTDSWTIAHAIKKDMDDIKSCAVADENGWMVKV